MAAINEIITVSNSQYRPCFVGNKKALFHCWEHYAEPFTAMLIGETSGQLSRTFGIVEYEDGRVVKVSPIQIRFVKGIFKGYCFEAESTKEENK